jgi:hypothetical protein
MSSFLSAIPSAITSPSNPITGKNGFTENSFKLTQNVIMGPFNLANSIVNNPTDMIVIGVVAVLVVGVVIMKK